MRSATLYRFAGLLLAVGCCVPLNLAARAGGGSDPAPTSANGAPSDQAIAKLIESLRAAERQFANLETVVKKKRQRPDRSTPIKPRRGKAIIFANFHDEVTARTVIQGDLFFSKLTLSRKSTSLRNVTVERTVAYDGKQTRTVETGSAANLHEGKSILVRPLPPQAWPLRISVPLSDFLAGSSSADEAHRITVDSLLTDNGRAPIAAIDPKIAGEETLKGLACVRLEFEQEEAQDGERYHVRLWLAKERHLIPVRQELSIDSDNGPVLAGESRVDEWLEVKPNIWLPKRITCVTYEPLQGKTRKESRRETILVEKANLDVHYPPEFFRDVKFPPELSVFTIKEGRLAETFRKSEVPADAEGRLKQIVERLREEEARYNRLSVNAVELRTTNPLVGSIDKTRTTKMRSLLVDDRAYTDARHETWHFSGSFRPMLWTEGFDGRTYRSYGRHPPEQQKGGYAWVSSQNFFTQAVTLVPVMLRPHSALIPGGSSYRRLTDILWPAPGTVPPRLEKTVEYLGEAPSGPFACFVLAVRPARARTAGMKSLLWLAKDRNLIPVRFEEYVGDENLPVRLEIVDKFQEPSHGVWYPAHKTRYIFRQHIPPAVREGYLFVDQCWDYSVQSVAFEPEVPSGIFSQIVVDEGIDVQYFDKAGKLIGKFVQTSDSVPEMPAGK
jgi:hypothetical protein